MTIFNSVTAKSINWNITFDFQQLFLLEEIYLTHGYGNSEPLKSWLVHIISDCPCLELTSKVQLLINKISLDCLRKEVF